MNPFPNILNINEFHKSKEGKKIEQKDISTLISGQYSNSLKNPFSNIMLRKTIIRQKIKTLSQIKKNQKPSKEHKIFAYKQNNLYINFHDQNLQKSKENNNIIHNLNIENSFNENNINEKRRNNDFFPRKKIFKSRNITNLKLLPSKTIHSPKLKSFPNGCSDPRIVSINNKRVRINRMNITLNNTPKLILIEEKPNQISKRILPKIDESKIHNRLKNKNMIYRNDNHDNHSQIKSLRSSPIIQYLENAPNIILKNKTNNEIIKANECVYKSISAERKNNLLHEYKFHDKGKINALWKSIKKEEKDSQTIPLSNGIKNHYKKRINIFTLLLLKNKGKTINNINYNIN